MIGWEARDLVGVAVAGARHQGRQVQLAQQPIGARQRQLDPEPALDHGPRVAPAPSHHAVPLDIRTGQHPRLDLGPLLGVELAPPARARVVAQCRRTAWALARKPAIQGRAPHATRPRGSLDRHAITYVGDGQEPDPLARVTLHPCQGAKLRRAHHPNLHQCRGQENMSQKFQEAV